MTKQDGRKEDDDVVIAESADDLDVYGSAVDLDNLPK